MSVLLLQQHDDGDERHRRTRTQAPVLVYAT